MYSFFYNNEMSRVGMRWTEEENKKLVEFVMQGKPIDEIAKEHSRNILGIKYRVISNVINGKLTLEQAHPCISPEELEQYKKAKCEQAKCEQAKNEPEQAGCVWSAEEEKALLEEIKTLNIQQVAILHKRTTRGIDARLRKIGCKLFQQGMEIDQICSIVKLSQ